ncbi:MAG: 4Fe-4S binding protein [Deltaproteobacteria bacterium]|jgi:nitroreductase/NAD-dependent dihydropyrimidine dehydrogenase PreA subunit|nr:4Fe-4S binding protein [Deltaproteobacteria bacterium]
MSLIQVNWDKCQKDGICVDVCPVHILEMDDQGGPQVGKGLAQYCIGCGHCVAACPHEALDNVRNPLARQGKLTKYPLVDSQTALAFLRSRRSIRRYTDYPVPRDLIVQLLDAARYAPSGHNSQGISYMVVDDHVSLKRIRELVVEWMQELVISQPEMAAKLHMPGIIRAHERGEDRILRDAPALIIATAPKDLRPAPISSCLALEYVELYATTLSLGTCWAGYAQVCAQQYPPLTDFLGLPEDTVVTGMMMVGYPRYCYHRLPERNPLQVTWFDGKAS